ncbi:MAG: LytTR family transcriptional regulator [Proteobacteria bacterium]|nr:LytTR family transcriptional regulator [Pseudomonadota bacterium]
MDTHLKKRFLYSSAGLAVIVVLVASVIFFRVVIFSGKPVTEFREILVWQAAAWLPWAFVLALIALPFGTKLQDMIRRWNLAAHVIAAVVIATAATLWFKLVSENISPFLDMEETRYGVFPWFFIFWFFFGLFLYWGAVATFGLTGEGPPEKPAKARLMVKTGKVSEVVKPEDVLWIEAQDYYSVLHLEGRQSWIKMTMKELEGALDPASFVRIHRSTIINVNHLKQIKTETSGKYTAIMNDGKKRAISRQGWRDLKKTLKATK